MSGESLVCLCIVIVFCFFVELTIFPRLIRVLFNCNVVYERDNDLVPPCGDVT